MDTYPFTKASKITAKDVKNLYNKTFKSVKEEIKMQEYRKTPNAHRLIDNILKIFYKNRSSVTSIKTLHLY